MRRHLSTLVLAALPLTALGHHPMGGETPQTFFQGLLSGLGHPVIEIDHFLFIIAFALLLGLANRRVIGPVSLFLVLAMAGSVLCVSIPEVPLIEAGVLLSTLTVGLALISQRWDRSYLAWLLAPLAGLCHGYAYGEAVIGAETTPILSYLAGFTLIQGAIMGITIIGARKLTAHLSVHRLNQGRTLLGAALLPLALVL